MGMAVIVNTGRVISYVVRTMGFGFFGVSSSQTGSGPRSNGLADATAGSSECATKHGEKEKQFYETPRNKETQTLRFYAQLVVVVADGGRIKKKKRK